MQKNKKNSFHKYKYFNVNRWKIVIHHNSKTYHAKNSFDFSKEEEAAILRDKLLIYAKGKDAISKMNFPEKYDEFCLDDIDKLGRSYLRL